MKSEKVFKMKFRYLQLDPDADDIQKIADVYVSESTDMTAICKPSPTLSSLISSDDVSEEIRTIFSKLSDSKVTG